MLSKLAVVLALVWPAAAAGLLLAPAPAIADDGDGDGGGGGGGGGGAAGGSGGDGAGGGGDFWNPFRDRDRWRSRSRRMAAYRGCSGRRGDCRWRSQRRARQLAGAEAQDGRAGPDGGRAGLPEIVVVGPTPDQLQQLQRDGFVVRQQAQSPLLGADIARLAVPPRRSARQGLARARAVAPQAQSAINDLYRRVGGRSFRAAGVPCGDRCEAFKLTAWTADSGRCAAGLPVGVIDTAIDREHPSLRAAQITTRTIRSEDRPASDANHGTGVLSLLAGAQGTDVVGLLHGARFYAADAFHGKAEAVAADVFDLVRALDWLVEEKVRIVNLSLTGPDNEVMRRVIAGVLTRGVLVVAAAGRPDPADRLGYPARYDGVVGVAAVDARLRPSRLSSRGPHVDFVAPGVGLVVAGDRGTTRKVDGTSFAAPFVTAAFARGLASRIEPDELMRMLAAGAEDLGRSGHDPIFGWGLVRFSALPTCR